MTIRVALVVVGLVALVIVGILLSNDPRVTGESEGAVKEIRLQRVSNASGLVLLTRKGRRVVATVDEVDAWRRQEPPPPLVTFSDPVTGAPLGGQGAVGSLGEVEALTQKAGEVALLYKTGAQRVVLRHGDKDLPLVGPGVIARLRQAARQAGATEPMYFEFEGLASTNRGWEVICSVVRPDARDTPRSTMSVFRLAFDASGALTRLSAPFRREDGTLHVDYAASLDVTASGDAIVGAFLGRGAYVAGWDGRVRTIDLPVQRVEGIAWDPARKELWMVRECVGSGTDCAPGIHFGVPLWVAHLKDGLPTSRLNR